MKILSKNLLKDLMKMGTKKLLKNQYIVFLIVFFIVLEGFASKSFDVCGNFVSGNLMGQEQSVQSENQSEKPVKKYVDPNASDVSTVKEALLWLEDYAPEMIRNCRREMKNGSSAYPPQVGIGYEAFWLRDYAYILEGSASELSKKDLLDAVDVFLNAQNPEGYCVDCVKFDGTPIYKPGYGSMGKNPVADGSPFTVAVVYLSWKATGDNSLLSDEKLQKLEKALDVLPTVLNNSPVNTSAVQSETAQSDTVQSGTAPGDAEQTNKPNGKIYSELVYINPAENWDRCPFGFTDTIRKKGYVLFSSLLKYESILRLAEMSEAAGKTDKAAELRKRAVQTKAEINEVFWDDEIGLYRAATIQCREPDIWGSAFAVYLGVADESALNAKIAKTFPADALNTNNTERNNSRRMKIAQYFRDHYEGIVYQGQIRHLPPDVYWEVGCGRDSYQNGAYWGTPTGWFVYALDFADSNLANKTIIDMVNYYQKHDAPEWVFGEHIALPGYMSSVTLPQAGIRKMLERRSTKTSN